MSITFTIPGPVRGKGRPRTRIRGNFAQLYTPAETVSYENLVKIAAAEAMAGRPPSTTAQEIVVRVYVVPPKSWSKKKQRDALDGKIWPTGKPDNDNILKIICDACNGIVYRDDAQIVDDVIRKRYGDTPFVHVTIREMKKSESAMYLLGLQPENKIRPTHKAFEGKVFIDEVDEEKPLEKK